MATMLNKLIVSLTNVWAIATTEIRLDSRLLRTWVFIVVAGALLTVDTVDIFTTHLELSAVSSSVFVNIPLLIPVSVFPDFQVFITFAIIFLAFDVSSRDHRERIDEVFATLPITNTQLVFGRALGICTLLYLASVVLIGAYYLVGVVCEYALPELGFHRSETLSTLSTIVIDTVPYLFFWTATVMLLAVLVKFRAVAAVIAIGMMLLMYWLQNNAPMYMLNFLGTYMLSTQLPSEIAPVFATAEILLHRVALVLLACAFLYLVSVLYPRLDGNRLKANTVLSCTLTAIASIGFVLVHGYYVTQLSEREQFRNAFERRAGHSGIDLVSMTGKVHIRPDDAILIDMTLDVRVREQAVPHDTLIFSLNPAYEIQELQLNDAPATYTFEHGVLAIQITKPLTLNEQLNLALRAEGNPNPNFAYFNSALDRLAADAVSSYGLIFLGTHSIINHSNYVALMPGAAWYPIPVVDFARDSTHALSHDYFYVDLAVVVPDNWFVGLPGRATIVNELDRRIVRFTPRRQVHEIGLFAAEFDRRTAEIDGVEFELLVSPDHTRNIDLFASVFDELKVEVTELLARARTFGLEYPFDSFSIVEVPTYLRSYGGGAHMFSTQSLPGIFLLREGTFLSADFGSAIRSVRENEELTDDEKHERQLTYLTSYFDNDVAGGNVLDAGLNNLFAYQTHAKGIRFEALGFVIDHMTQKLFNIDGGFYSAFILKDVTSMQTARWSTRDIANEWTRRSLSRIFFDAYVNQPTVWDEMLNTRPGQVDPIAKNTGEHHHAQYLIGQAMGDLLVDWYGPDRAAHLLAELRRRYLGTSFTDTDFRSVARELDMPLDEIFGELANGVKPAGFRTSTLQVRRLADSADGQPFYENSLFVENAESTAGLFKVEYATQEKIRQSGYAFDSTEPIKLAGNSAVEVSIHTSTPVDAVRVRPYLSLNRATFAVRVEPIRASDKQIAEPKPLVRPVNWSREPGEVIVVDDLDEGFAVEAREFVSAPWLEIKMLSFSGVEPGMAGLDQGLISYSGFAPASDTDWMRQQVDTAFGKYRRTLVRAESGATPQKVVFQTHIPRTGTWQLAYHLPDVGERRNRNFRATGRYGLSLGSQNDWTNFDLSLAIGESIQVIEFDGKRMQAGWNTLGTYELTPGEVTLSVSTKSPFGTIVADAIRWSPAQ